VHFSIDEKEETLNNPVQKNHAYITIHGVPKKSIKKMNMYLKALREKRNLRNKKMTAIINEHYKDDDISIDYEKDICFLLWD
jgi:protoheme ferro-lyase